MAIKKIQFDGQTLIDLTNDTVTAASMRSGVTAHNSEGNIITGTMSNAGFSNITTSTATTAVPLVTTAGYSTTNKISGLTVPTDTSLSINIASGGNATVAVNGTAHVDAYRGSSTELDINSMAGATIYAEGTAHVTQSSSDGSVLVNAKSGDTYTGEQAVSNYHGWIQNNVSAAGTYYGRTTVGSGGCTVAGGALSQGTASGGGLSGGDISGGGISGGTLSGGDLSAGAGEVAITQQPKVTPSIAGSIISTGTVSYGITTSRPSGTDGTNYLTLDPNASYDQQGKAKGRGSVLRSTITRSTITRATITRATVNRAAFSQSVTRAAVTDTHTAGYISASSSTPIAAATSTVSLAAGSLAAATSAATTSAATTIASTSGISAYSAESSTAGTVNDGTNYYVPIVTASATGGTASASASIAKQPSASATNGTASASASQTGMTDGVSTTATSYYFTSSASATGGSASAASGYSTASASATGGSASVGKGITAGASASGTSTGNKSATSTEVTKTANGTSASNSSVIYLKAASCTYSGGGLSQGTASGGGLSGGGLSLGTATAPTLDIFETAAGSQDANVTLSKVDVGAKDTTNYPYYFKVSASSTGGGNTVTRAVVNRAAFSQAVTHGAITCTHSAGYLPNGQHPAESAASSTVQLAAGQLSAASTTATAANGSTTEYVKLAAAGISVAGGGLSQSGNSGGGLSGGGLSGGASVTPALDIFETAAGSQDTNVTLDQVDVGAKDTTNYKYYFKVSATSTGGTSTVTRDIINRDAFSNTVTRAAVTDTRTEGWLLARSATTIIGSGTSTVSLAAGSIAATSKTVTVNANSTTEYVKMKGGVLNAVCNVVSNGSASISASGFTPVTGSTTSYYVKLTTSAGSAKGIAGVATEGYVKNETATSNNTSVPVNGNNTYIYIPAGSATPTGSLSSSSTSASLSGSTITLTAGISNAPSVSAGYIKSGTYGNTNVTLTGTVPTQSKTASSSGTISPDSGKLLSSVSVPAGVVSTSSGSVSCTTAGFISTGVLSKFVIPSDRSDYSFAASASTDYKIYFKGAAACTGAVYTYGPKTTNTSKYSLSFNATTTDYTTVNSANNSCRICLIKNSSSSSNTVYVGSTTSTWPVSFTVGGYQTLVIVLYDDGSAIKVRGGQAFTW